MKCIPKRLLMPLISLCVAQLSAAVILVDFNDDGPAPTTSNGVAATWNVLTSATGTQALVDSTGAASGVSISFTHNDSVASSVAWNTTSTAVGNWQGSDSTWLDADAAQDYFWGTYNNGGGVSSIVFSGLNNSLTYNVELVAARSSGTISERIMPTRVNGAATSVDVNSDTFNSLTDGYTNSSILRWSAVAPVSGAITIAITDPSGASSYFVNAASITAIPEPSSLLLLGIAGLGAAVALRRKQRQNS